MVRELGVALMTDAGSVRRGVSLPGRHAPLPPGRFRLRTERLAPAEQRILGSNHTPSEQYLKRPQQVQHLHRTSLEEQNTRPLSQHPLLNKKQCSRQLQCQVPCGVGDDVNSSLFINSSLSSLSSTSHAVNGGGLWGVWLRGGGGQVGGSMGGRGHFGPAAIHCTLPHGASPQRDFAQLVARPGPWAPHPTTSQQKLWALDLSEEIVVADPPPGCCPYTVSVGGMLSPWICPTWGPGLNPGPWIRRSSLLPSRLCEVPLGQAPCVSAVYGKVDEMSSAPSPQTPLPLPPPPPKPPYLNPPLWLNPPCRQTPPVDSMTGGRQGGQGRIDDITDAARDFALQLP